MPNPASKMMSETVMAAEIRSVKKICNVDPSRSCQLSGHVTEKLFKMPRQRWSALRITQFINDHGGGEGPVQQTLRDFDV